jgi:uncharacterized protein (TIGR02246 family)
MGGFVASLFVLTFFAPFAVPPQGGDEAAVREVVRHYDETRGRGDWKAYGALFTTDADQRISSGTWRRGTADIVKGTADSIATTYKGGKYTTTVDRVRMIASTVALVDAAFEISNLAGGGTRRGLITIVLVKDGGQWRIAATRSMVPTPAGALPAKP